MIDQADGNDDLESIVEELLNDELIKIGIGIEYNTLELVCPLKLKIQDIAEQIATSMSNNPKCSMENKLKVYIHLAALTKSVTFILDLLACLTTKLYEENFS